MSLTNEEENNIIQLLQNNVYLFTWAPSSIPGIDPNIVCHHLTIKYGFKPLTQRKHKEGEDKRETIYKEVKNLKEVGFIQEIKYPTWFPNMVKKTSGKWLMCVDFIDLNQAFSKDPYPISSMNQWRLGFLSFELHGHMINLQ